MLPSVSIVTINWNSAHQLRECLESLVKIDCQEFKLDKVIVVDNASTDRSIDGLEHLDLPLHIIRNSVNQGFGAACNQGAAISNSDYLLFLNPDTRVSQDSIGRSVTFMEESSHQKVGVVGVQLIDEHGQVQRNCVRFPSTLTFCCNILGIDKILKNHLTSYKMTEWDHENTQKVDQIMGAFYLIRGELFQRLEGFDERFFVYFEDLDLSYRVHKLGWSSYYLADVRSFHKGGGTSENVKSTRLFYFVRSRILYAYKHFNLLQATTIALASLSIEPVTRIIFALLKRSIPQAKETIFGYAKIFKSLKSIAKSTRP
ncbi:glycosyltransferase family 2 protein [Chamaesiphon sp. VAR_69_metabat_338]|uniref:glycosyltransferase family 2 protein n=1 Tax=Chamaesiphon sp. VAR_69_metabat_338 TaxID=2964704 RepID=UPI00286E6D69|nr:glycosyltransferase family 2 protein [Chamaesiphon sp. VAR_69_metabat_338]